MLKWLLKFILIMFITGCIVVFGCLICFLALVGAFDKDYRPKELVDNFNKREKDIYIVKHYFGSIVPKDKIVEIEFEGKHKISRLGIASSDSVSRSARREQFMEWDIEMNTPHMDSILGTLGWNRETLKILKEKLDRANCIGIASGEPAEIAFKRSGMGMYSFLVFDNPMPDTVKAHYNNSCNYIFANDKLVLVYGGGAIGPQCFYNK
jgi:hypothetical protein